MKLSIKKEILLENLNNVSKGISSKNVIPVLGGIKFNLTNEGLFLTSTNNEIDIEVFIDKKYHQSELVKSINSVTNGEKIEIDTINGYKSQINIIKTAISKYLVK